MQCPQCNLALRLEVESGADSNSAKPTILRRFQILDLLAFTAIVAIHFAMFPAEASTGGSEWSGLLYLTPTAITCLLHLRLRLKISLAVLVHYCVTAIWTFLHAVGLNFAINAHNNANPSPGRDYQLAIYSNAWSDTIAALGAWGVVFAAVYGVVSYSAVRSSMDRALAASCHRHA